MHAVYRHTPPPVAVISKIYVSGITVKSENDDLRLRICGAIGGKIGEMPPNALYCPDTMILP
jgi:hypothetical protein